MVTDKGKTLCPKEQRRRTVQIILDFVVTTIAWKSICNPLGKNAYFAGRKVQLSPIFMLQPKSNQLNLCRSKYITVFFLSYTRFMFEKYLGNQGVLVWTQSQMLNDIPLVMLKQNF